MRKLVLIALSGLCSQFTNAAPMLLTVEGRIHNVIPQDTFLEEGFGVVATWRFDSDMAGISENVMDFHSYYGTVPGSDWIEWSVKVFAKDERMEFEGTSNADRIMLRDQYGTSSSMPTDVFTIEGRSTTNGRGNSSSVSIVSETRNLINSNLDQEQSLLFSGDDINAEGSFYAGSPSDFRRYYYYLTSWKLDNLAIVDEEPIDVPEPGSLAILGLGLLGFGLTRRAGKRQS